MAEPRSPAPVAPPPSAPAPALSAPAADGGFGPLVATGYLGTTVRVYAGRPRSLDAVLRRAAERWPGRTAVQAPAGCLTYRELDRCVSAACGALLEAGVRPGARIAVALGHDLPLLIVPYVASRLGVTALLLSTALAPAQWSGPMARARVRLAIADGAHERRLREAAAGLPQGTVVLRSAGAALRLDGAPAPAREPSSDEDHPVALIATSGTTGVPKTTRVTSRGLIHAALAYRELLGLDGSDRTLVALPLHYIGPLSAQTTTMPLVGGAIVVADDPRPPACLAQMARAQITYLDAVPAWLGMFLRAPHADLPSWRTLIYGGAPMPPETAARLAARYPSLRLFDVWGLSETHGPATALRYDPRRPPPPGAVGRSLPGVEVRADDSGELLVRGANVTPGYLDDPELNARVLADGWLRTGDVGRVDAEGGVCVLDRRKDVILRGGANVFSVQVEQVLCSAPGVAEAAVFGVADGLGGEAVAAVVVLEHGARLDAAALRRLVGERISGHAVPRRLLSADALPRNPTGKIDKHRLRRMVASEQGAFGEALGDHRNGTGASGGG